MTAKYAAKQLFWAVLDRLGPLLLNMWDGGMTFLGISYVTHRAGCHPVVESWGSGTRSKAVFQRVHKGKILTFMASFPKGLSWCGRATLLRLIGGRENLGWVSLQWGHGASSLCIYASCQPSHSWFLCAEMSVGFYPMSSAPCSSTDFRYVWGFSETCSRSSRALIYLLIECTFVLVQSLVFAVWPWTDLRRPLR